MDDQGSEKVKPTLVARLGKFIFHEFMLIGTSSFFQLAEFIMQLKIDNVVKLPGIVSLCSPCSYSCCIPAGSFLN
jgi:hypothetical protein